jgi:hypothetical protein
MRWDWGQSNAGYARNPGYAVFAITINSRKTSFGAGLQMR